ncbi:hypothetical protein L1887_47937 [Cichorium endivia]|nr:hypothetical protein L1887_47937 [Cichorium endivia]
MDRQYPDYPQYDHRRPWTYHSASPSAPLASLYGSSQPARPEPVASARPPQERRRSERWTGPRAIKRSIPHNGATCDNRFCDEPDISPDERLCPGPKGLNLCAKCYKRFKIERRRAMEGRRAVTDAWMRPRRPRSVPREPSPETLPRSQTPYVKSEVPASSVQDAPSPVDEKRVSWNINESDEHLPIPETRGREPTKHASPLIAPSSPSEKSSLHSVSSVSLREHDRHTSRSPRKHRSRGRDDRRYRRHSRARNASTFDEAEYFKYGRMEENRDDYDRRCCCSFWSRRRKCVVFGGITLSVIVLVIIVAVAATVSRKSGFKYTPSTAQVNNTAAFESGGATPQKCQRYQRRYRRRHRQLHLLPRQRVELPSRLALGLLRRHVDSQPRHLQILLRLARPRRRQHARDDRRHARGDPGPRERIPGRPAHHPRDGHPGDERVPAGRAHDVVRRHAQPGPHAVAQRARVRPQAQPAVDPAHDPGRHAGDGARLGAGG